MEKIIYLVNIVLVAILLLSCEKDDATILDDNGSGNDDDNTETQFRISKISGDINGVYSNRPIYLEYNSNGLLSKVSEPYLGDKIEYNENEQPIKVTYYSVSNNNEVDRYVDNIEWIENGFIITDGHYDKKTTFYLNSNNQIKSMVRVLADSDTTFCDYTWYGNDSLILVQTEPHNQYQPEVHQSVFIYTFGKEKNPFYDINVALFFSAGTLPLVAYSSEYIVIKERWYLKVDGVISSGNLTTDYTYTFNDQNHPENVAITVKYSSGEIRDSGYNYFEYESY